MPRTRLDTEKALSRTDPTTGGIGGVARRLPNVAASPTDLALIDLLSEHDVLTGGLQPDTSAGLFHHLYVDTCPPTLQNPEITSVPAVVPMRPAAAQLADAKAPAWLDALPDLLVYVTLGTIFNRDLDVFRTVIEGLRDQPVSVVVTVGRRNDPSALGPQPANVAVHQYIPQATLLPHCRAAVIHGGAGTMLGALAASLPLLFLPQGADQHSNADRVIAAARVP